MGEYDGTHGVLSSVQTVMERCFVGEVASPDMKCNATQNFLRGCYVHLSRDLGEFTSIGWGVAADEHTY